MKIKKININLTILNNKIVEIFIIYIILINYIFVFFILFIKLYSYNKSILLLKKLKLLLYKK